MSVLKTSSAPGIITLWSDIGCPWASLAVHRLRRRRKELALDGLVVIDHRAFPLELINSRLTPKTIVDSEVAVVGSHEPELGWRPWSGTDQTYPWSTLLPMEAVQAAKEAGGLTASENLDAALRHAWYAQSRSIHLWKELTAIADEVPGLDSQALIDRLSHGAGRTEVFADWKSFKSAGVQGSPHLFIGDGPGVHNPGITLQWSAGQFRGLPVITHDDPTVYDVLLRQAAETT